MNFRLTLIYIFIGIIAITLLSRVYFLSIKSNTYYEELSKNNYIKKTYLAPTRGVIEDRNGEPLALNQIGFSILNGRIILSRMFPVLLLIHLIFDPLKNY